MCISLVPTTEPAPGDQFIPIHLKLGVERERVIENAVEQIRAAVFRG